jgi:hypothetical protein
MTAPTRVAELINTVAADDTLRDRLTKAADDAARTEIMTSLGFGDVTPADVRAHASATSAPGVEEVDDAQLAEVAGGGDTITTLTTTTTVTASAVAAT